MLIIWKKFPGETVCKKIVGNDKFLKEVFRTVNAEFTLLKVIKRGGGKNNTFPRL